MTSRSIAVLAGLSFALACGACQHGPNAAAVKQARTASYACDADHNWDALVSTVRGRYAKAAASETRREVITMPRWYHPDGTLWHGGIVRTDNAFGAGESGAADSRQDHRYKVQLFFALEQADAAWRVVARPVVHELKPPLSAAVVEGAAVPAWVQDRVDGVLIDYRKRNAKCAVTASAPASE